MRRFELWAKRTLIASALDADAKRNVEQYRQLRMMSYARQLPKRRSDNGQGVRDVLHRDIRLIINFVMHLKGRNRKLQDFDKTDAQALQAAKLSLLRPFLIWLRQSKVSSTSWVPKCVGPKRVYRGVGIAGSSLRN